MRQQAGVIILLMGLLVASLALNLLQAESAYLLIDRNRALLESNARLQTSHPVHDCAITAFSNQDGTISVWVNGYFKHLITDACGRF